MPTLLGLDLRFPNESKSGELQTVIFSGGLASLIAQTCVKNGQRNECLVETLLVPMLGLQTANLRSARTRTAQTLFDLAVKEAKEEGTVFEHLSAERLEEELSTILCQRDQDSNPLSFAYLIEKVKLCARAIRQSDTRASFYKKIASSRVPPVTRKIKSSTRTRFSSQLAQFESILENHSVLKCMADDPSKIWPSNLYFNGDEIQQIQCLVETMKPMEELISIFSMSPAKHGPLWGVGVPVIHAAMSHYQGLRANDECNAMNRNLAGLLHEELEGYIGSLVFSAKRLDPTLYEIAALLDPRCVLWLLCQEFHTLEQYQTKLRNTEIWLLGLPPWDEKERVSPNPVTEISTSKISLLDVAIRGCISAASSEGAVAPSGRTGRGGGHGRVRAQVQDELCQFSQEAASNSELATMDGSQVMDFWFSKSRKWPRLSRLALHFAAIPMGSIDVERMFSCTGNHIGPLRARMSPLTQQRDAVLSGNPELVERAAEKGVRKRSRTDDN